MPQPKDVSHAKPQAKKRPTIGLLIPIITLWGESQWHGVVDAAHTQGVNLFCFPGHCLRDGERDPQANILYELVYPDLFDGLVVHSLGLEAYTDQQELRAFLQRFAGLPLVSTEDVLEGTPSVVSDDYQGIREVMIHLIETHGYRRFGFLDLHTEVPGHAGFLARYQAFVDTLAEYDLPFDPRLVFPAGGAYKNMPPPSLVAELGLTPGQDIEAVVGCNDEVAVWFIKAIQAQGIRVPQELAVVGFNDNPQCRAMTPPLTVVKFPAYEMGCQATQTLLALLAGQDVAAKVIVPGPLIIRQSCGCADADVAQITAAPENSTDQSFENILSTQRNTIVTSMAQVFAETNPVILTSLERLIDCWAAELITNTSGCFLTELEDGLQRTRLNGEDLPVWQKVISVLRHHILPYLNSETAARAHQLLEQARITIERAAQRHNLERTIQDETQVRLLVEIGQILVTKFDLAELTQALVEQLPRLGIKSCYLAVYEDPQPYVYPQPAPEWSRLVLAYTEQGRLDLPPDGQRFRSAQLVPEAALLPQERAAKYVVEPLYFQQQQLGFVIFEMGPRQGFVYNTLRGQISSALKGALLLEEQERAEKALEEAYARVEKEVQERTAQLQHEIIERERLQQQVIDAQQQAIRELSTPVIPIIDVPGSGGSIIVMPLIGNIDSLRAKDITRSLLAGISRHRAKVVILDVTGVEVMDTGIVDNLNKTIQAARLKGTQTIVTGISEAVAESIVDLGIDWRGITTLNDLQTGLVAALHSLGIQLTRSRE